MALTNSDVDRWNAEALLWWDENPSTPLSSRLRSDFAFAWAMNNIHGNGKSKEEVMADVLAIAGEQTSMESALKNKG